MPHSTDWDIQDLAAAQQASMQGARSASSCPQVVRDAVDHAIDKLHDSLLVRRRIENVLAWCYVVARNAACRLASKERPLRSLPLAALDRAPASVALHGNSDHFQGSSCAYRLRTIDLGSPMLTSALRLLLDGVSLHEAARLTGCDRSNLRRSMRRLEKRLLLHPPHTQ